MFAWVSSRLGGEVDRVDATIVVTCFIHINFVPCVPDGTFVSYPAADTGEPRLVRIPPLWRSIAAGYPPIWGPIGGAVIAFAGLGKAAERGGSLLPGAVGPVLGIAFTVAAWWLAARLGRLPPAEQERRRVYGAWIGPAIDPVLCGKDLDPWLDRLRGLVAARARTAGTATYRSGAETHQAWFEAALASEDAELWGAAFTLARAEMARTTDRADRAALAGWHEALWKRLVPHLRQAQAAPGVALLQTAPVLPGKPFVDPLAFFQSTRFLLPVAIAMVLAFAIAASR